MLYEKGGQEEAPPKLGQDKGNVKIILVDRLIHR
jgi:hypothetical protein